MKILFADKFPAGHMEQMRNRGHQCDFQPDLRADDLPRAVAGYEMLVVRSTRVTAETVHESDMLKMIVRAGAGTNTIDKNAAADKDIRVCNVPGRNALAVAELTMGLLIAIDRNIPDNVNDLRAGRWDKKRYSESRGLYGRKLGIVGLGAIGLAVAERASAFGLKLYAIRKPERPAEVAQRLDYLGVTWVNDLRALAQSCDILSFHVPGADATRELVGRELLSWVQPGTVILNTSRGDVIDEDALLDAIEDKGLRVGLDVYRNEPGTGQGVIDCKLARHPAVYGTHHIGASTAQAQNAVADGVVEIVDAYAAGRILHCVNM